ncbi:hypothetical protein AB0368_00685 [Actinoplanes sp. NPDC051475]|uniref:hypothetical protein n=1 Tax=Actinoplanes sp. NPDC051475 TaxID=3157225 RepID=UPI003450D395
MNVRPIRAALTAAAVAAVALVTPGAAQAAPPSLTFSVRDGGVPEAGKWFQPSLHATDWSSWRLDHTKLVIDTTAVADFATA